MILLDEDDKFLLKPNRINIHGYLYHLKSYWQNTDIKHKDFSKAILSFIEEEKDNKQEIWMKTTHIQPSGTTGDAIVKQKCYSDDLQVPLGDSAKLVVYGSGIIVKSIKLYKFPVSDSASEEYGAFMDEDGPDKMYNLGQGYSSYPSQDGIDGWGKYFQYSFHENLKFYTVHLVQNVIPTSVWVKQDISGTNYWDPG